MFPYIFIIKIKLENSAIFRWKCHSSSSPVPCLCCCAFGWSTKKKYDKAICSVKKALIKKAHIQVCARDCGLNV